MANKKKKSVYHKSHLKQQASHLINDCINDCIIRALEAPSLSRSVHVTVPSNSNSPHNAPSILPNQSSCPFPQLISTNHSPAPQDPSPSINHIFVHDYSDGEELDEDVDLNSSGEDYVGGSKFFISSAASPTAVSPSCASSAPIASPVCAPAFPVAPMEGTVPSANTAKGTHNFSEPPSNPWRNLFASNRNTVSCPRLLHYSVFTDTKGCNLVNNDLNIKCDL
ncbi:hypothetical protein NC653_031942 [Populus alba x Populus x berolinensis]|uniref:Uncharacterized protein n=1 Tax=Populus alba x Populus x berolinensis TaxID=444605 RepID=A0AAD6Q3B8_9ROSI|nr:hypothetical protein NC653_031942 [Populus alba x Populus x berolinensis]